ncbi:MAG: YceH family protein [Chromatiales bacterium]
MWQESANCVQQVKVVDHAVVARNGDIHAGRGLWLPSVLQKKRRPLRRRVVVDFLSCAPYWLAAVCAVYREKMKTQLSPIEARVIGCLIEKEITTPDQYPLSLNALTNACNQKSNRDPVMSLDDATVQRTLDELAKQHLVMEKSGFGSRVLKYKHRFCNTEHGALKLSEKEIAVACELLLRGPQTPGELRGRASRMTAFADVSEVEATLQQLMEREDGPFVTRLPREPGRRESRYAHLFSGEVIASADGAGEESASAASVRASERGDRLAQMEEEVRALRAEVDELKRRLGD